MNRVIVGARGSGKTHYALALAAQYGRAIYIDPTGTMEVPGATHAPPGRLSGRQLVRWREGDSILDELAHERAAVETALVVDEFAIVNGAKTSGPLCEIVRMSRHLNYNCFVLSQRCADVTGPFLSTADFLVLFRLASPRDLKWVAENIDQNGRKGDKYKLVSELRGHQFAQIDTRDWSINGPFVLK